jgi:hypothetical protein
MSTSRVSPKKPWKIDSSIDVDRVTLEDVKLIFSQAEKRLDDTVKAGENIAAKSMSMITLMAGVLIALIGFIISNWDSQPSVKDREHVAIAGYVYILVLFIYTIWNILPKKYFVLGSEPEQLMLPSFFASQIPKDKITVFIYMSEIENYNFRIEKNLAINNRQRKLYSLSVIFFLLFPIVLGVLYCLLEWLR